MSQTSCWTAPVIFVLLILTILQPYKVQAFVSNNSRYYCDHARLRKSASLLLLNRVAPSSKDLRMMDGRDDDLDDSGNIIQPTIIQPTFSKTTVPVTETTSGDKPSYLDLRLETFWSLELLAAVVSIFFAGTIFLAGDVLFAAPPSAQSTIQPRFNADKLLQEDFERMGTFVPFE